MGASREGFNLFNKWGRHHFRMRKWKNIPWEYVWKDTLGKYICAVLGHSKTFETDDREVCCHRCYQIIEGKSWGIKDATAKYGTTNKDS